MTPHRSHGRGSFVIDRQIGRIGRIRVASGTSDTETFRRINDMITTLRETGRWDLLQALRDGAFAPLELWGSFKLGQVDRLPTAEEVQPASKAISDWLERAEIKDKQREHYRRILTELLTGKPQAKVTDLPILLRRFRETCQDDGRLRTFNMTRSGAQSFLRSTLGSSHRLWHAIADIGRLKETPRPGNPQSLDQVGAIAEKMGEAKAELWSLCLTGMRRAEYWHDGETGHGPWEPLPGKIRIVGKGGKVRIVPELLPIADPVLGYSAFLRRLREATNSTVIVHDLRKTFTRWMEESGIPRQRRKLYLGHGKTDVTDLYELHEVTAFLADDAERMRVYLGDAPAKALRRIG